MPDWYLTIVNARYARMSAPDFVRLPMVWQEMYETARLAEIEAAQGHVEMETP
jgi:hypothetical protein